MGDREDSRQRLAMLASIGTLMIKKVVRNKKRTTFLIWKEKTEVARERERFMEVRAVCEGVRKGKDEELKDVESDLRKVRYNLDLEKKERLDLEQLFAKYQHELVALKQKETELKSAIRENLRTKRDLQVEFKHELRNADTRRSSLVEPISPPPSPPPLGGLSSRRKSSPLNSSKFTRTVKAWHRTSCVCVCLSLSLNHHHTRSNTGTRCDIVDSKCVRIFQIYQSNLRRIFLSVSLASSREKEQRITKDRWSTLMSRLRIVPDMIPRRVAMETWFSHSTNDVVLGPSLSYNDFLRSLVSLSSIVYSASTSSTKNKSSEIMLIHLFVQLNRYRVRFQGAEKMLKDHSSVSSSQRKTMNASSDWKIVRAIEDASIDAIRVSRSGRPDDSHDIVQNFRSLLPEAVSAMPKIMLAGLRCRVYDVRIRSNNRLFWTECQRMMTAHNLLDSTLSLSTVRRIFHKHHDVSSSRSSEGLCFGSFVLFLLEISRVKYPAESKILSFQRVVAKLMGVSLHVNNHQDQVHIGLVRERKTKRRRSRKNTHVFKASSSNLVDENNLYESIVSLRKEFDRFVLHSSPSSSSSSVSAIGLKNESIGLLI